MSKERTESCQNGIDELSGARLGAGVVAYLRESRDARAWRGLQRVGVLLVLVLATACSSAVPARPRLPVDAFHEASIRTRIEVSSAALVFRFSGCGTGGQTFVRWARIYDIRSTELVCALERTHYSKPTLEGPWRYGSHIIGYTLDGCAPLKPGVYQIAERGAGGGGLDFEITNRGAVLPLGEWCDGTMPRLR